MRLRQVCTVVPGILCATVSAASFWDTITPSQELEYHECHDGYQCARLLVPLDWLDQDNENTVALAIIKLPAKVPENDTSFGGTIFTNPGGPGSSGVDFLLDTGLRLQGLADGNKSYEILSWDPRGTGNTTAKLDCFENTTARGIAALQERTIGPLDASGNTLRRQWALTQAYGQICEQSVGNDSVLPYLTTASTARDMVEMVDRVDELRKKTAQAASTGDGDDSDTGSEAGSSAPARIMYWGFSYGTHLGNTFASMFPGRVGRMIIDGVINPDDYMKGTWLANLQDTEKVVEYFYQSCFEAGDSCALKRDSDTKWEDMKDRVDDFKAQLDERPVSVLGEGESISIITGNDLLAAFYQPVYSPLLLFSALSQVLSDALDGNYTLLLENMAQIPAPVGADAGTAIKCGDGEDDTGLSFDELEDYVDELKAQSPTMGSYWATTRFQCSGWTIRPKDRFTGPFTTPEVDPTGADATRPAAPLLLLSSRYDPVTPLRNAQAVAAAHPGAAWVVQESAGHPAENIPSACVQAIVQAYLETGVVPESGTSCAADCDPWNLAGCL